MKERRNLITSILDIAHCQCFLGYSTKTIAKVKLSQITNQKQICLFQKDLQIKWNPYEDHRIRKDEALLNETRTLRDLRWVGKHLHIKEKLRKGE